eukprot:TRINITY_DN51227_c0_g1_i1.p1 TRINITY_DN51227_c0_g1~~TRINITY_DN51227_c0_g1_i1.p1  ORF type:complete len:347 (-),score=101.84 TRINITY_DN51227_c0_g1_i1:140-1180(-)
MAPATAEKSLSDIKAQWQGVEGGLQDALRNLSDTQERVTSFLKDLEKAEENLNIEREKVKRQQEEVVKEAEEVKLAREKLEDEKARMQKTGIGASDLVGLNFGGQEVVTVKRSLLLQCEDSFLAAMFSGRHEDTLDRDSQGNVFLDYSPSVMLPLIEYLRLKRDAAPEDAVSLPDIPECNLKAWDSMLRVFMLSDNLQPPFVFSGIRQELKISELHGWTMFFCEPYSHATKIEDFTPPGDMPVSALLVGERKAKSDTLAVAAMGNADFIITHLRVDADIFTHNGVSWCFPFDVYCGFGFDFDLGDSALLWKMDGEGGDCAAGVTDLEQSTEWEKVIFASKASIPEP